jgi:adenylate cyclase class 2
MAPTLEREIKLRFDGPQEARAAVIAAGGTLLHGRRLQDDCLLDTPDGFLRQRGSVLRVRQESGTSLLTFKGPVQPSVMKLREELETAVGDGTLMLRVLEELGFRVWFRYQKYREEFALEDIDVDVIIAVDETPVGTYVEIEGGERGIATATGALGREAADYLLDSYRGLFVSHCQERGLPITDMIFAERRP